jgi:hypothetical protein
VLSQGGDGIDGGFDDGLTLPLCQKMVSLPGPETVIAGN